MDQKIWLEKRLTEWRKTMTAVTRCEIVLDEESMLRVALVVSYEHHRMAAHQSFSLFMYDLNKECPNLAISRWGVFTPEEGVELADFVSGSRALSNATQTTEPVRARKPLGSKRLVSRT